MRVLIPVMVLSLLAFSHAGLAQPSPADEVPIIHNPALPRDGVQHLALKELWRAGGEDDETFFGLVAKVASDDLGRVYVLDSQTCQVYQYDADGELLRVLFREGEGPGEVRQARDMVVMGDGRIGVIQELPGAISFVHPDGTPAGRTDLLGPEGGTTNLTGCQAAGQVLLVSGTYNRPGDQPSRMAREMTLERFLPSGEFKCRLAASTGHYDFADFRFRERDHLPPFWFAFDVAADGRTLVVTQHQDYAIRVFDGDGNLIRIITRDCPPCQRTPAEIRSLELMIMSAFGASPLKPSVEIEEQAPALSYFHRPVHWRPDGTIWALSRQGTHPEEAGVMAVFDVMDQEGLFVSQTALHAPHDIQKVGVFFAGTDRVLVVKGYMDSLAAQFGNGTALEDPESGQEAQSPEVICYQMVVP